MYKWRGWWIEIFKSMELIEIDKISHLVGSHKDFLLLQHLYVPFFQSHLLPPPIQQVVLFLVQQVPFAINVVCVICYCYFHFPCLRSMLPNSEVFHKAQQNGRSWALDRRRFVRGRDRSVCINFFDVFVEPRNRGGQKFWVFAEFFINFIL